MSKKVSDQSTDLFKSLFQKFKEFFPLFVREGEVDFDGLQKFFKAQKVLSDKEKYGLTWAGKGNAFKAIQTKSVGTLVPQKTDSKSWDTTENLFIEGDNLEVLKLLQKNYREKIKIIYIDPPYNTGHDFVYKDNFTESVADYYEKTGQSENGVKMSVNTEKNGSFHSENSKSKPSVAGFDGVELAFVCVPGAHVVPTLFESNVSKKEPDQESNN
jgi:adenine-specific DNA-methyltransferase